MRLWDLPSDLLDVHRVGLSSCEQALPCEHSMLACTLDSEPAPEFDAPPLVNCQELYIYFPLAENAQAATISLDIPLKLADAPTLSDAGRRTEEGRRPIWACTSPSARQ